MSRGQAERLFPLMEEVLAEAGFGWQDLDGIGCGTGPGNFTGIRLSVSAARGLALSLGKPAIGVSALEALAYGADGQVLVTLDARRDQLFAAIFGTDTLAPCLTEQAKLRATHAGKVDTCIGHLAEELAIELSANAGQPAFNVAVATALIAASRLDTEHPRPAPLYLKAADAAPSREQAPAILP